MLLPDEPNKQKYKTPRPRLRRARRWLLALFPLTLLLVLAWAGWQQHQLGVRQAAAPVISVAEDGTLRINGQVIEIGGDGLPPKALAELEGAPPVEKTRSAPRLLVTKGVFQRLWSYPRTGLFLFIIRSVEANAGIVRYRGLLISGKDLGATLEFRGQRWWLGRPGPLGGVQPAEFEAIAQPREVNTTMPNAWRFRAGHAVLYVRFGWFHPFGWMKKDWFQRPRLGSVSVQMPEVRAAASLPEKLKAYEAAGSKDVRDGW